MKWIESSVQLIDTIDAATILKKLEIGLRNCYKSEDLITDDSAVRIIRSCINRGHESPLEHVTITYRVICDRGVSHEWVRHRLASYSQESTRYCNYTKGKFGHELTCIYPYWYFDIKDLINKDVCLKNLTEDEIVQIQLWNHLKHAVEDIEQTYFGLIETGAKPDAARAILPNCLKTEIVCTMNIRELRNFFKLRCSNAAHPDIRKLAKELLQLLRDNGLSVLFEDLEV